MTLARAIALSCIAWLAACGYRPASGRVGGGVPAGVKFAPFLVANDTAELALTHAVIEASRGELGRRGVLAVSAEDPEALKLQLRLRSIGEMPASYAPNGEVIEYFGQLSIDYQVYAPGVTAPVAGNRSRLIAYRYDFRENPQNVRILRQAAVARSVRDWIPQLLAETTLGLRYAQRATAATATEMRP